MLTEMQENGSLCGLKCVAFYVFSTRENDYNSKVIRVGISVFVGTELICNRNLERDFSIALGLLRIVGHFKELTSFVFKSLSMSLLSH